ncbi:cdc42 homolog [Procambarus clarkii]|uniref:cdc42 homolog n=1 Tax=Procambarus clarkii TaxID=6728 RepID=UPI001E6713A5|nr:cdc42 homolog [Procambarus clarkii]
MSVDIRQLRIVVVGDGAVGKTSFLKAYTEGSFPMEYIPTIFDNYIECFQRNEENFIINFVDTAGQSDYDQLRPLSYKEISVCLVCFNVNSISTYENVKNKWLPEVRKHCGDDLPILLVGLQTDLRAASAKDTTVSREAAQKLAHSLGLVSYVECSAKTCAGCDHVIEMAIQAAISPQATYKGCCSIL